MKEGRADLSSHSDWKHRKIFVTGVTGFIGTWLTLWLHAQGASVTGYARSSPAGASLFARCGLGQRITLASGDIRDRERLYRALVQAAPDLVVHLAAQPLVSDAYRHPDRTFEINVMGSVHLLEAVRRAAGQGVPIRAVINVTSDRGYENRSWPWGYREEDRLGGDDPYSGSKACAELVTSCYRNSYFHPDDYGKHGIAIATARTGNVIGGGDASAGRLVPDTIRALQQGQRPVIRQPGAVRAWQHVLEPIGGYMLLARRMMEDGKSVPPSWNFSPDEAHAETAGWVAGKLCEKWGDASALDIDRSVRRPGAPGWRSDSSKAKQELGWRLRWDLEQALDRVIEFARAERDHEDLLACCLQQIEAYDRA